MIYKSEITLPKASKLHRCTFKISNFLGEGFTELPPQTSPPIPLRASQLDPALRAVSVLRAFMRALFARQTCAPLENKSCIIRHCFSNKSVGDFTQAVTAFSLNDNQGQAEPSFRFHYKTSKVSPHPVDLGHLLETCRKLWLPAFKVYFKLSRLFKRLLLLSTYWPLTHDQPWLT